MVKDFGHGTLVLKQLFRRQFKPVCFQNRPCLQHQIPMHLVRFAVLLYDKFGSLNLYLSSSTT
jgi:hypothetical protein